jgi:hypothetical protein
VLDCALALPFDEALAVADSALRSGLVTSAELDEAVAHHHRRGAERVRRVVRLASPASANPVESALRGLAIEAVDLPWTPQLPVVVAGKTLHPDVGLREQRIVLEAEGYEFHGGRQAFAADCWRYNELTIDDWLVLRFAWEHVMFAQSWVQASVAGAVELRAA